MESGVADVVVKEAQHSADRWRGCCGRALFHVPVRIVFTPLLPSACCDDASFSAGHCRSSTRAAVLCIHSLRPALCTTSQRTAEGVRCITSSKTVLHLSILICWQYRSLSRPFPGLGPVVYCLVAGVTVLLSKSS